MFQITDARMEILAARLDLSLRDCRRPARHLLGNSRFRGEALVSYGTRTYDQNRNLLYVSVSVC